MEREHGCGRARVVCGRLIEDEAMTGLRRRHPCLRRVPLPRSPGWTKPEVAPRVGFEPTTSRLTAGCSTTELPRIRG